MDSFLGARKNSEHEANTSMKTEFMTMWDGFQTNEHARVMVLAATNRPWEVDDAILRRLPRSFEVGLPDYKQRVDILSVILRNEPLSPGFLGPAPDAPVFQIARATERYSGSDLKELCKQAAYGPIRDLLDAERAAAIARQRARLEKALKKQASKSGGTGTHPGVGSGVDDLDGDLDEFFDAEEERDESGARNDGKPRRKRAMTLADFSAVLSNSGTSADAAAKYRHADNERRFDRDARAAHSAYGGGGCPRAGPFFQASPRNRWRRSSPWSRPRWWRNCWERWPASLTAPRPRPRPRRRRRSRRRCWRR